MLPLKREEQPATSGAGGVAHHSGPEEEQHKPNGGAAVAQGRGSGSEGARQPTSARTTRINGDGSGRSDVSSSESFRGAGGGKCKRGGKVRHDDGEGEKKVQTAPSPAAAAAAGERTSSGRARRQRDRRRRERAAMAAKKSLVKKVKDLGKVGRWRQAISEVDSAIEGGLLPDEYVYGSCVGAAADNGQWQEALGILRRMREDGVEPTTPVYNAAIKACARGKQLKLALALLEEMRSNAAKANAAPPAAAPAAAAAGAAVPESPAIGDSSSWSGVVGRSGTARGRGGEGGVRKDGLRLNGVDGGAKGSRSGGRSVSRRTGPGAACSSDYDPDIQTINTVMAACAAEGEWELALEVMKKAQREDRLHPTRVTYNTAISACGRRGESDRAVQLLREMRVAGLAPDTISYNSAIAACAVKGQWRRALSLLGEMGAGGKGGRGSGGARLPSPDVYSFGSAITACGRGGQWSLAVGLLGTMRQKGIAPGVVAFNAAISACGEAGQWERALGLLRDMEAEAGERGREPGSGGSGGGFAGPNRVSFNAAINACSNAGEWQQAVSLLEEMRRNGNAGGDAAEYNDDQVPPANREHGSAPDGNNEDAGLLAGSGAARSSDPRECTPSEYGGETTAPNGAEGVSKADRRRRHRRGRTGGPTPDVVSYSATIMACSRAGNWERALGLLEQMREDGLEPNSTTFTTMISAWRRDWGYGGDGARGQEARGALLPLLASIATYRGLTPDARLYGSALDACADASLCQPARDLLAVMVSSRVPVDDRARRAVATACAVPAAARSSSSSSGSRQTNEPNADF
ncbi:unnamed protein product [Ectocarpus sp. CCAP 1310/34]|nr:unnamed protein product [Ectocarpus sp. CCAP 1310/34]